MNTHNLKAGDRVRVRAGCPMQAYLPGDTGTVRHDGTVIGARVYYTVEMDGPETENIAVFAEDEIEPDL